MVVLTLCKKKHSTLESSEKDAHKSSFLQFALEVVSQFGLVVTFYPPLAKSFSRKLDSKELLCLFFRKSQTRKKKVYQSQQKFVFRVGLISKKASK